MAIRFLMLGIAVVSALMIAHVAVGQVTTPMDTDQAEEASDKTKEFIKQASIAGNFEVMSSKVAMEKSKDPEIRAFAQKMIDDHTQIADKMRSTLKVLLLEPLIPVEDMDDKHQSMIDDLRSFSEENFDARYIGMQKDGHDEAVALFQDYIDNGDNQALKDFVSMTIPTLKLHQKHVDQLYSEN